MLLASTVKQPRPEGRTVEGYCALQDQWEIIRECWATQVPQDWVWTISRPPILGGFSFEYRGVRRTVLTNGLVVSPAEVSAMGHDDRVRYIFGRYVDRLM